MSTQEYQEQLHVPEVADSREVSEEVCRALAHPTLAEAKAEAYLWPCGD